MPGCYRYFLALCALVGLPALADEVQLANGDRITGEVQSMSGGKLNVKTGYAGVLHIDWSEVRALTTARPISVMLQGMREPVRGAFNALSTGRAILIGEGGQATEVSLGDVRGLNPKPYETGRGVEYRGRALLSAAYSRGNAPSNQFHADGEFNARAKPYRYTVSARIDRRDEPELGARVAWLGSGNYDRFIDERHFGYVRGSLEHDRSKDLERRTTAGIGYGVQLFDSEEANVSLRGGLDYVTAQHVSELSDDDYPAFGWGLKVSLRPWGPRLEMFHEHEGFWNLQDSDSVVVRSKTGIRVPIMDSLNATAQLNADWERSPAPGRVATDTTLLFGVDYSF